MSLSEKVGNSIKKRIIFCFVKNIGKMDRSEVIWVYRKKLGDAVRNYKELIGFYKVLLLTREEKGVFLEVYWEEG